MEGVGICAGHPYCGKGISRELLSSLIGPHACVEGRFKETAVVQQTDFVAGHPITDLGINLRSIALQGSKIAEVSQTCGVLHPSQELLARDDPNWEPRVNGCPACRYEKTQTILLFLGPIKESVDHVDGRLWDPGTRVCLSQVNRMCIEADGLAIAIVMIHESCFHVLERGCIVDGGGTVGGITRNRGINVPINVFATADELTAKGPSNEDRRHPCYRRRHTWGSPRTLEAWVARCKHQESTNNCWPSHNPTCMARKRRCIPR